MYKIYMSRPPQDPDLEETALADQLAREEGRRRFADRRERIRTETSAAIPRWYSPVGHLAATTGIGITVLAVALTRLHDIRPFEWMVIPLTFVLANGFEWRVHKNVLHRRFWPFEVIYDRHTPMHHVVFVEDDMEVRSRREWRMVLMPAAGVLGAVLVTAPFALAFGRLGSPNAGWLLLVTAALYMVTYELSHLAYHLSPDGIVGRNRLVRRLREHHARHHDPRLMQRYNFNVTIPLFDWVMGTMAPRTTGNASNPAAESR